MVMNSPLTYGKNGCIDEVMLSPLGEHDEVLYDSYSSRMVVSDADDDDASVGGAKHTPSAGNEVMKVGSFSSHTSTTIASNVVGEPRLVTPKFQDSREIISRKTKKGNKTEKNGEKKHLPFCPPLFYLTDARKTTFTIQPRVACEEGSHNKLVDEYAVMPDRRESLERHDVNACRTSKPEDSSKGHLTIRIHKNQLASNLHKNRHKIADCLKTPHDSISNQTTNKQRNTLYKQQNRMGYPRNQSESLISHKISSDGVNTIATKMPSKVAACLPRQRSRAIAIKRSRPGDFVERSDARATHVDKDARRCDVELYDYATWRMYNRIIDHRRKHLLQAQHQDELPQEHQHSNQAFKNNESHTSNQASTSSTIDEQNANGMVHPSSTMRGQRGIVHRNTIYTGGDYLSGSECDDEIFDLEL
jgi:hypothetical protein